MAEAQLVEAFELDSIEFLTCLRRTRRGVAAGPSGMTSDHLFPVLENEGDSELLCRVASLLSVGQVPEAVLEAIRLGRVTALSKRDGEGGGEVRGNVVGDVLRRLVARTIAQQVIEKVEAATAPFQYALSTKAGCECVAHILQTFTDLDPEATIMSIDGVGAYDLISWNAMLEGLLRMEGGDQILPFVKCFHGRTRWASPSTFHKGKEGIRATPSCHCCLPWDNTVEPSGIEELTRAARALKPEAVVWRGDPLLLAAQQGVRVLGIPIGKTEYVQEFLEHKTRQQQVLFQRIPWVNNTQSAFLLLSMCGATRDFWLRAVRPEDTKDFARRHDENVWACLREILGTPRCVSGSACLLHLVIVSGRFGTGKRSSCSSRCTLGKLGRFPPNGQTEEPSDREADDPTVGG